MPAGLGDHRDGLVDAADLVDEAVLDRLLARPDAAACDRVDLFGGLAARRRHQPQELVVDLVDAALDLRAGLRRPGTIHRVHLGAVVNADDLAVDAHAPHQRARLEAHPEHADGPQIVPTSARIGSPIAVIQ